MLPAAAVLALALVVVHRASSGVAEDAARAERPHPAPSVPAAAARPEPRLPSDLTLPPIDIRPEPNPLAGLTATELNHLALTKPAKLGSVCVGRPNRGHLWNSVELTSGPGLHVMVPGKNTWGTEATVASLRAAAAELHREYPRAGDVRVGDLSRERGGYLRPHRSHQLGVDADVGYFYQADDKWYRKATAENLDRELTWAFVKALIAGGNVEYIFMDRSVQALLRDYALERGEDAAWLDTLFESPAHRDTLIRHVHGHVTHFHVRFIDPAALRLGRTLDARLHRRRR